MYAQIALPGTGFKTFTYKIPPFLEPVVTSGKLVVVPFRNSSLVGAVVALSEKTNLQTGKLKSIQNIIDPVFSLSPVHLALLNWISEYYICPVGDVLKAAFPPGVFGKSRIKILPGSNQPSDSKQKFVFEKIRSKPDGYVYSRSKTIIPGISNSIINKMISEDTLCLSVDFKIPEPRKRLTAIINDSINSKTTIHELTQRRKELLNMLINHPEGITLSKLSAMGFSRAIIDRMADEKYLKLIKKSESAIVKSSSKRAKKIELTLDQSVAVKTIGDSLDNNKAASFLLFGVTGSGKTEVYIEAARKALAKGKSVLILLPEISLTPQAISRFSRALNAPIGLWHSRITSAQRADIYCRAKKGKLKIVLGVRSAVFVPLQNLGLIVIDEEQDDSFKQSEPSPRYNARDVALMRAKIENAVAILGSATPSMESYHNALSGKYQLLKLPQRFSGGKLPKAFAIDLKNTEIEQKYWPLSDDFIDRVCRSIADDKQVIILLNRRGYSGILMCKACGYVTICPECRVALTLHKSKKKMLCHYCGYSTIAPDICPECSGSSFDYRGIGTQKLEELLSEILGEKGIIRMDSDSTAHKGALEKIISTFEIGEKPVLLGTRMVAKGHHFPGVGLVGVVLADAGLHLPDFRASEKVFQLLVQAAGRAGRSKETDDEGEFVIQTYDPSSGILGFATDQNYETFYKKESAYRRELGYPPYGKIIRIIFSGEDDSLTRWAARKTARGLAVKLKAGKVLGPAATGVFRLGNKYHYQLVLKGRFNSEFKAMLKNLMLTGHPGKAKGVIIKIDIDPREMV